MVRVWMTRPGTRPKARSPISLKVEHCPNAQHRAMRMNEYVFARHTMHSSTMPGKKVAMRTAHGSARTPAPRMLLVRLIIVDDTVAAGLPPATALSSDACPAPRLPSAPPLPPPSTTDVYAGGGGPRARMTARLARCAPARALPRPRRAFLALLPVSARSRPGVVGVSPCVEPCLAESALPPPGVTLPAVTLAPLAGSTDAAAPPGAPARRDIGAELGCWCADLGGGGSEWDYSSHRRHEWSTYLLLTVCLNVFDCHVGMIMLRSACACARRSRPALWPTAAAILEHP